jgi:predicted DNA-binding transcriptional regulator YafY
MDRTERFYRIDRLLRASPTTPFVKLREALGVSPAQLKRDLAYMRERLNAPIEFDRDAKGYKFGRPLAGPRYELPGLWFSAEETHALLTLYQVLKGLDSEVLGAQVAPFLERLRAILGAGDHSWKEVENRIRLIPIGRRAPQAGHFGVVAGALMRRRRLHVTHFNRASGAETERDLSPQSLVYYRDNWYLDAWCHLRNDLRSFSVDAFRAAAMLEERAKEVPKAELEEYLSAGYGIFAGRKVEWATIRFTPLAARWVSAQRWHSKQKARTEADGSYVLEVPYANDQELLMEVLKFGPEAEVLGPPALRKRAAAQLQEAARRYT